MFRFFVLSLALTVPLPSDQIPSLFLDDRIHQPYVELIGQSDSSYYTSETLGVLRSKIEREREEKLDNSRKMEKQ